MNEPRFTIAISCYNIEKYIGRAIDSVLNQNFDNYEIIVVDDCSTDNSMDEIKKYESDKLKILKTEKNSGSVGTPRNVAIDNAKGEYIIFLDGDDTLYDDKTLQKIDNVIGNDKSDIIYLGYEDAEQSNKERISNDENSSKEARLICDVTFSASSRCWRKEFLIKNNMKFVEGIYYEDVIFSLKSTILSEKTKNANIKIFKYYRNREGSITAKPTVKKCSDWYRMLSEVMDLYAITPDKYKPYLLSFIRNETESVIKRIANILEALENDTKIKQMPKRDYKFRSFFDE